MGIEVAAGAMLAISAASAAGQAVAQNAAANSRQQALDLQTKEMQVQAQDKTLSNYSVMEKTIAAQRAAQSVTGLAANSPSFNAIQRNTLNVGARNQANTELTSDIDMSNLEMEKQNVNNTLYAQLFGDVGQTANAAAAFTRVAPSNNTGKAS
jgi:hypothetical protein